MGVIGVFVGIVVVAVSVLASIFAFGERQGDEDDGCEYHHWPDSWEHGNQYRIREWLALGSSVINRDVERRDTRYCEHDGCHASQTRWRRTDIDPDALRTLDDENAYVVTEGELYQIAVHAEDIATRVDDERSVEAAGAILNRVEDFGDVDTFRDHGGVA